MKDKKLFLVCGLLLGAILAAPALSDEKSWTPAQEARKAAERRMRILNPTSDMKVLQRTDTPYVQLLRMCQAEFTTDYEDPIIGGGHIDIGDRFLIRGPVPFVNMYVISPIPSESKAHRWANGNYPVLPHPMLPNAHHGESIPIKQHDGSDKSVGHGYAIVFPESEFDENGCPTYVHFYHDDHHKTGTDLHPGHAGAVRD